MKNRLIICAGRSRSGSTLLYNMVRITLEETLGVEKVYARVNRDYNKHENKEYHVIKIHEPDAFLYKNACLVFSSIRNAKDQRKSIIKLRKIIKGQELSEKEVTEFIEYDLSRFNYWKNNKNFKEPFDFDELVGNKCRVIKKLSLYLNVKITEDIIAKVTQRIEGLKLPPKGYDIETGLTSHHFTSKNYIDKYM